VWLRRRTHCACGRLVEWSRLHVDECVRDVDDLVHVVDDDEHGPGDGHHNGRTAPTGVERAATA
jgi:hypothetical protein